MGFVAAVGKHPADGGLYLLDRGVFGLEVDADSGPLNAARDFGLVLGAARGDDRHAVGEGNLHSTIARVGDHDVYMGHEMSIGYEALHAHVSGYAIQTQAL